MSEREQMRTDGRESDSPDVLGSRIWNTDVSQQRLKQIL